MAKKSVPLINLPHVGYGVTVGMLIVSLYRLELTASLPNERDKLKIQLKKNFCNLSRTR